MDRLRTTRFRGALVGPEGSGKTTLLEEIYRQLIQAGVSVRLLSAKSGRAKETLAPLRRATSFDRSSRGDDTHSDRATDFLLIDSAERLTSMEWLRLKWSARKAAGLVVTSHRPGLLPTLLECTTTPELLAELVCELLEEEPAGHSQLQPIGLGEVYARHDGNVRSALRELYDLFSGSGALKPSTVTNVQWLSSAESS